MRIQDKYKTRSLLSSDTTRLVIVISVPVQDIVFVVTHPTIIVFLEQPTDEDVGSSFRLTHLQLSPQPLLHDRQSQADGETSLTRSLRNKESNGQSVNPKHDGHVDDALE